MGAWHSDPVYPDAPVVDTKYGKLIGRRMVEEKGREADAYQGIPYAAPPVGDLRFRKPQPPDSWQGVRKAQQWPNRGMQMQFPYPDYPRHIVKESEDNLYLNVFCPGWDSPPGGFPVIVYIHGGSFQLDGTATYGDIGICKYLVSREGCVVVTIQYRLGLLGFWTVGDESACPNNLAFWDQTQALRWVQENIEGFGGNKNNVTLLGQSAGGVSTDCISISPVARGLFHKVGPLAGNAYCPWANTKNMKERCEEFARKLGIEWSSPHDMIEKLRAVPAEKMFLDYYYIGEHIDSDFSCTPTYEGEFLPKPRHVLRKEAPPTPMLTGLNKLEGLLFSAGHRPDDAAADRFLDWCIPPGVPDRKEAKKDFMGHYLDVDNMGQYWASEIRRARLEVWSDRWMNVPALRLVHQWAEVNEGKANTYLFNYEHFNAWQFGWRKYLMTVQESTHSNEIGYLLGKGVINAFKFTDDDIRMTEMTTKAFANFAKYGDPNGPDNDLPSRWEPITKEHPERHFVFRLRPRSEEEWFEGRPTEIIRLHEKYPGVERWEL